MNYNPLSPAVQDNPHPYYAELRDKAPVAWIEPMQAWAVSRYADVDFILRNPRLFSSALWNTAASGDLVVVPEAPGLPYPGSRPGAADCRVPGSWTKDLAATICDRPYDSGLGCLR